MENGRAGRHSGEVHTGPVQMVHLATTQSEFEARLLAARLGAEGMLWQLRGESSIYPTGGIDVLVDAADLDDARVLLTVNEVDDALDPAAPWHGAAGAHDPAAEASAARWINRCTWVAVVALALVVAIMLRGALGG